MGKTRKNGIKTIIIGVILVGLIAGYYYYLSNKERATDGEEQVEISPVQEILMYDFERSYPPTPKETVRLFAEITKSFYNETYTEEEFLELAAHIQNLYDQELIANKTSEQYIEDLRSDVEQLKAQEIVLSSYRVSASTDVEYDDFDGCEWAKLYCSFTLRQGTDMDGSNYLFLLRKDEEGHWKIFGWTPAEEENPGSNPGDTAALTENLQQTGGMDFRSGIQ